MFEADKERKEKKKKKFHQGYRTNQQGVEVDRMRTSVAGGTGPRRVQDGRLYLKDSGIPSEHFSASVLVSPIFILLTALNPPPNTFPHNKRVSRRGHLFIRSITFFYFLIFLFPFIIPFPFYPSSLRHSSIPPTGYS
jgi:hypothetical protein